MAQSFLLFDFGSDEEAAQRARHTVDGWKQAFRLDKKLLLKFAREEDEKSDSSDSKDADSKDPTFASWCGWISPTMSGFRINGGSIAFPGKNISRGPSEGHSPRRYGIFRDGRTIRWPRIVEARSRASGLGESPASVIMDALSWGWRSDLSGFEVKPDAGADAG